jgi:poly-gamma-glutamate capsule biosynthesis protein CapA/YwtB (metallophosphatase superfamily)
VHIAWKTITLKRKLVVIFAVVTAVAAAAVVVYRVSAGDCAGCLQAQAGSTIEATLRVIGESGKPISGATVSLYGIAAADDPTRLSTSDDGTARTPMLSGPAMAVVEADGHLAEPVPLGWSDAGKQLDVRLFARTANRFAMHNAGDVMFGRRYASPVQEESSGRSTPLIPDEAAAAGAERVVSAVAPAFAAADFRTVNLETALSDLPAQAAYPGKRFILESAPQTVSGLKKLSVDLAVQANNHARDLLDAGVADTRAALTGAGIGMVGAGAHADEATQPYQTTINGTRSAVLAYTSVEGSFVNSSFPEAGVRKPADLPAKEEWQYQERSWGFAAGGVLIPTSPRRIREAWERFETAEPNLSPENVARMWASLTQVYPEMQDWVARRGHGGAAVWDDTASPDQIRLMAQQNQLVMVQVHAGFQFQDAASDNIRDVARKAIDAGADIVVAHHPHVLQGMEWYKGRLIAYSLGNFVFDQNFLNTFSSVFLRTLWEGDRLIEARVLPIEIVDYQPAVVTDDAAARVLAKLWERSGLPLVSYRDEGGGVRTRPFNRDSQSVPAEVVLERHTGRITQGPATETAQTLTVGPGQVVDLPAPSGPATLVRPTGGAGVQVGRDLFGWGHFEDESADGAISEAIHWSINSQREGAQPGHTPQGRRFMRLEASDGDPLQVRTIARIALPRHRAYKIKRGKAEPDDPAPAYSLTALVRRPTNAAPELRFDVYHFDDSNPTEDPTSDVVVSLTRPVDVPADGEWHRVVVDLPVADLDAGPAQGNMIMPYFKVAQRGAGQPAWMDVDDVRFIEWRDAAGMTKSFGPFTMARNPTNTAADLAFVVRAPAGR